MKKVLFITTIPAPYRVAFFNELGSMYELTVIFEKHRDSIRNVNWYRENALNFSTVFLDDFRMPLFRMLSIIDSGWDMVIIGDYSTCLEASAIEYLKIKRVKFAIEADGGIIKNDNNIKFIIKKHLIASSSFWFSSGTRTTEYLAYYGANKERCYEYPFSSICSKDILDKALTKKEKFLEKIF